MRACRCVKARSGRREEFFRVLITVFFKAKSYSLAQEAFNPSDYSLDPQEKHETGSQTQAGNKGSKLNKLINQTIGAKMLLSVPKEACRG